MENIIQNKKTYLFLKALELADDHTRTELLEWYSNTDFDEEEKIAGVKSIFTRLDIPAQTKRLQTEFEGKAMEQLNGLDAPSEKIEWLKAFAEGLMKREF